MSNRYGTRTVAGEPSIELEFADAIPYKTNISSDGNTVYKAYDYVGRDGENKVYIFRTIKTTESSDSSSTYTTTVALDSWDNRGTATYYPVSSIS